MSDVLVAPGAARMKDRILHVWEQQRAEAKDRTADQERRIETIQQKLDRLDEAFLCRGRRRTRRTGLLAFEERVLPRASDLCVQASLEYKQRLQALFLPEGIAYDGNRFNRTAVTAPLFNCLAPDQSAEESLACRAEARI